MPTRRAFYAVFDRDDANHSRSQAAWANWLREGEVLMTNNYVLLEVTALRQHSLGMAAVRALYEDVVPVLKSIGCRRTSIEPAQGPCSTRHEGSCVWSTA